MHCRKKKKLIFLRAKYWRECSRIERWLKKKKKRINNKKGRKEGRSSSPFILQVYWQGSSNGSVVSGWGLQVVGGEKLRWASPQVSRWVLYSSSNVIWVVQVSSVGKAAFVTSCLPVAEKEPFGWGTSSLFHRLRLFPVHLPCSEEKQCWNDCKLLGVTFDTDVVCFFCLMESHVFYTVWDVPILNIN